MVGGTAGKLLAATVCAAIVSLGCGQVEDSLLVGGLEKLAEALASAPGTEPEELSDAEILARLDVDEDDAGERRSVVIEGGEFSSLEEGEAPKTTVPIYRYTDENGVVRMVQGKHAVPERYRNEAQNLSKTSMPVINRYEPQGAATRREISYKPSYNPNRSEVLLYSADWCGACRKAKAFLDREGVNYELLDIDRDQRARSEVRRILGRVSIPLIDIDGTYIRGFAPQEIRRALRKPS